MTKIYIPLPKGKYSKPEARGLWLNDKGKLYYDYIKLHTYKMSIEGIYYKNLFNTYLDNLRINYKQEAIFYTCDNIGYVYYNKNNIDILPKYSIINITFNKRHLLRGFIKAALKLYKGVTVTITKAGYTLEIWYK